MNRETIVHANSVWLLSGITGFTNIIQLDKQAVKLQHQYIMVPELLANASLDFSGTWAVSAPLKTRFLKICPLQIKSAAKRNYELAR